MEKSDAQQEADNRSYELARKAAADEFGVDPDELTPYDLEKLTLLQLCYSLLRNIRTLVFRVLFAFLVIVVTAGIVLSAVTSHLSHNVDKNTTNITKFSKTVQQSRDELHDALVRAQQTNDPTLVAKIVRGLDQIDKLCQQTKCEG